MKIEQASGKEERSILIGMIVDKHVLGRVASRWDSHLFETRWANTISELCVKYFQRYKDAPAKQIQSLFEAWSSETRDKEATGLIGKFLASLSDEYEQLEKESNSPYLIDLAGRHFNQVKLKRLARRIEGHIDQGKIENALRAVSDFGTGVHIGAQATVDVFNDLEALSRAFSERAEPLITLRGDLGKFFGRSLQREGFICLMGPEKRGKTAWLVYLSTEAAKQRKKVAFFAVGDESEEEMMLRFSVLVSKHSLFPDTFNYPTSLKYEGKKIEVEHEEWEFEKPLSERQAKRAFSRLKSERIKSQKEYLRLSVHPNSSLSIEMIDDLLTQWETEGFVPDVVVVDYMDILLETGGSSDARDRINATWKAFRGLMQKRKTLGLTATQANAASYKEGLLSRANFSEDKRKLAHVTGMVGLNQTKEEYGKEIMRLNWIVRRGFRANPKHVCHCAMCLEIANPAVLSLY